MESMHTIEMINNSGNTAITFKERKKNESRIKTTSESTGTEQ